MVVMFFMAVWLPIVNDQARCIILYGVFWRKVKSSATSRLPVPLDRQEGAWAIAARYLPEDYAEGPPSEARYVDLGVVGRAPSAIFKLPRLRAARVVGIRGIGSRPIVEVPKAWPVERAVAVKFGIIRKL
jgi:hypothetical protein